MTRWTTYLPALAIALLCSTESSEAAMSAAEFEAYTTGKTLYFGSQGQDYGAEDYRENRRVRWSFLDGQCKEGYWYEGAESQICFVYEDRPETSQCWTFERSAQGLIATFMGESGRVLYEARRTDEPMLCLGPEVGV
ncbi:hypothetical protein [Primorskyibacter sp. S187A]|uniref:hypothetical protein n=1 Tax=Primorskyibacter sp. S187A TaxID=3415130 RepID=UPI003C7BB0DD